MSVSASSWCGLSVKPAAKPAGCVAAAWGPVKARQGSWFIAGSVQGWGFVQIYVWCCMSGRASNWCGLRVRPAAKQAGCLAATWGLVCICESRQALLLLEWLMFNPFEARNINKIAG
jgi:hypothetical protein